MLATAQHIWSNFRNFLLMWRFIEGKRIYMFKRKLYLRFPRGADVKITSKSENSMVLSIDGSPILTFITSLHNDPVFVFYYDIKEVRQLLLIDGRPYTKAVPPATKRNCHEIVGGTTIWVNTTDLTKKWIINITHPYSWPKEKAQVRKKAS